MNKKIKNSLLTSIEEAAATEIIKTFDNYEVLVSRPLSVQRVSVIKYFCLDYWKVSSLCIPLPDGKDSILIEKKAHRRYKDFINWLLTGKNFYKHLADYEKQKKQLLKLGQKATKIRSDANSLYLFFSAWHKTLRSFSIYFISPFMVEDELYPLFMKGKKSADLITNISLPTKLFGYQKFQQKLVGNITKKDYSEIIKQYAWINEYSLKEKLLDENDIKNKRTEFLNKEMKKVIDGYPANLRHNQALYKKIIASLKGQESLMAEIINAYVNIRTERIEVYQMALVGARSFFAKLAELAKKKFPWFSYYDAISLTTEEIFSFLKNGDLPSQEHLDKRRNRQMVMFYKMSGKNLKQIFIYQDKLVKKIVARYLEADKSQSVIKGISVSTGLVRGRVRMVFGSQDFKEFQAGEILVSHFTSPEFMSVISKAGAIITDEGGVTSHAAIVSRELGKPCIVGTKVATKALKNGDLVEVDANKGAVRIIKQISN